MTKPTPDYSAEGAALASLELHRALIALLVARGVIPRDDALHAVDFALARVEKMQGGAASLRMDAMAKAAEAARAHLEVVLHMLAEPAEGQD